MANGGLILTCLIKKSFGDIKYKFLFSFFIDICKYSDRSFKDHLSKLEKVLISCTMLDSTVNPAKMTMALNSIQFLGYIFKI